MSMIAGDIIYFSGDIWSAGSEKTHPVCAQHLEWNNLESAKHQYLPLKV